MARKHRSAVQKRRPPREDAAHAPFSPFLEGVLLFLIVALFTALRLRLLDLPLERDEGEYAYAGQLLLQGIPPYALLYNMKWPGVYAAYAAIMALFGQSPAGIRIGLTLVTSATIVMLFFLGRRLFGPVAALAAAATVGFLSIVPWAMGPYAHATHFVACAAVAGALLIAPRESSFVRLRLCSAGVLFAIATLMKQVGIFFLAFGAFELLASNGGRSIARRLRETGWMAFGAAVVFAATAWLLYLGHVFDRFWFWTIDYGRQYAHVVTFAQAMEELRKNFGLIFGFAPGPWLIAAAGLGLLVAVREMRPQARFVIAFTIASVAVVIPGLYFRPHYFIVLFPAVALLSAAAVAAGARVLAGRGMQAVPATAFALALVFSIGFRWSFLAETGPEQLNRRIYSASPFAEAATIGDYIREHTSPSDRIAVLGSEPEIYFYAQRRSATGYIYTYPLMEKQKYASKMQREMIAEVERANPRYLVMVGVGESWREQPGSDRTIFDWSERVANHSYTLDGIADMLPDGTRWVWGPEAARYEPRAERVLMVFRRHG